MSDNKKYYYMRLKEDFFDSDEMIMLESMPSGHQYANILLKLYLKSLKHEGRLVFRENIPYSPEMLSTVLHVEVGIVKDALDKLAQLGLIEILDSGVIYMNDIQLFIGRTSTEGDRKKAQRKRVEEEKQQALISSETNVGHLSAIRTPEKEIDIELETEQEKKTDDDNLINKLSEMLRSKPLSVSLDQIQYLASRLLRIETTIGADTVPMIDYLLDYALAHAKEKPLGYALVSLENAIDENLLSLDDLKTREAMRNAQVTTNPVTDVIWDVDIENIDWSKF